MLGMILIDDFIYAIFGEVFYLGNIYMIKEQYGISLYHFILLFEFLIGNEKVVFKSKKFEVLCNEFDKLEETKTLFRVLKSNGINPTDNLIALFNEAKEFEGAAIIMQAAHDVYGHKDPEDIDLL